MLKTIVGRAALATILVAAAACSQAPRETSPRLSDPLPPPGAVSPGGQVAAPIGGAQDVVLRGAAYAVSGDGRFPPNSRMTVRVYDASLGNVNEWAAEKSFSRSGGMPWPYDMRVRLEAVQALRQPALAARIEGPDGRLIYQSEQVVPLVEGGSEDIPMSAVSGGGAASVAPAAVDPYTGTAVARGAQSNYGIPDINTGYGARSYDSPVYPGQSFEPTTISGPPSNSIF